MTDGSRTAILAEFFANLGIAISKAIGFSITGSTGLLAETVQPDVHRAVHLTLLATSESPDAHA